MGTDLAAQVAHADFVRAFGARPIDLRWYGGVNQFSYSLTTPALIAVAGARWIGVVSAVTLTGTLTYLLVRTGARRPLLGGILVALIAVGNLVSGRITFAAGLAVAACAMAVAIAPGRDHRILRLVGVGLLGVLSVAASPVAGLFLGVGAMAWLLAGLRWDRSAPARVRPGPRTVEAVVIGVATAAGLGALTLVIDGGVQPYTVTAMREFVALTVVVALVIPAPYRALRAGALLTIGLLVVAYLVPSPLGANVLRLPMLFAIPVVAAYVPWRGWALAALLAAMFWWAPPIVYTDIGQAGAPETRASFYRPLLSELAVLGPIGRIEVVPLRDHWESVYVANAVPLARGWLRQVDVARNPLFYRPTPVTVDEYGNWLRMNAASYVAVAPGQPLDSAGGPEAAVIAGGPSYLREVWYGGAWKLYQVLDPRPFVSGATLISSTGGAVIFDASSRGPVTVRVRWSRWLTATGGACVARSADGWSELQVPAAGRYTLTSGLPGNCRASRST